MPNESLKVSRRDIFGATLGNALEFYDFTTYAFFAGQIGRAFFPASTELGSLLLSLATFGAGFVTRPLGAFVLGRYADRVGRRPAMLISFALMGAAILGVALCPSYATIGPAACFLIVAIRLVQGFALGGEVGSATAFLLEVAPPDRRGLYTALQPISQNLAALVAGIVGFSLANVLDHAQLDAFGWRIALLLGAAILPFGFIVRRSLPETLHLPDTTEPAIVGRQALVIACSLAILAGGTVATYIQSYLTTYAGEILRMQVGTAFTATITYGVTGIAFNILGGWLSDRFGRKPVLILPRILLLIVIVPAFLLLDRNRDMQTLTLMTVVMTACASTSGGVIMAAISESIPKARRSASLGILYSCAIALFGGTTQFVVTWLISVTGTTLAPAYFYMAATLIGIAGMWFIPLGLKARDRESNCAIAP